jgi:hypothetical protein
MPGAERLEVMASLDGRMAAAGLAPSSTYAPTKKAATS